VSSASRAPYEPGSVGKVALGAGRNPRVPCCVRRMWLAKDAFYPLRRGIRWSMNPGKRDVPSWSRQNGSRRPRAPGKARSPRTGPEALKPRPSLVCTSISYGPGKTMHEPRSALRNRAGSIKDHLVCPRPGAHGLLLPRKQAERRWSSGPSSLSIYVLSLSSAVVVNNEEGPAR
jgi:hypothetical protein